MSCLTARCVVLMSEACLLSFSWCLFVFDFSRVWWQAWTKTGFAGSGETSQLRPVSKTIFSPCGILAASAVASMTLHTHFIRGRLPQHCLGFVQHAPETRNSPAFSCQVGRWQKNSDLSIDTVWMWCAEKELLDCMQKLQISAIVPRFVEFCSR